MSCQSTPVIILPAIPTENLTVINIGTRACAKDPRSGERVLRHRPLGLAVVPSESEDSYMACLETIRALFLSLVGLTVHLRTASGDKHWGFYNATAAFSDQYHRDSPCLYLMCWPHAKRAILDMLKIKCVAFRGGELDYSQAEMYTHCLAQVDRLHRCNCKVWSCTFSGSGMFVHHASRQSHRRCNESAGGAQGRWGG